MTGFAPDALGDRDALNLIFTPGFSTAAVLSDVSGRGVGMDIVRSNLERVGGRIGISSTIGQGSCFTIYLPLTLRGIIAGVTLVFVVSLGFYITPALLGGGKVMMFAMVIEQQVREFLAWNFAGALSVILLAVTLLMFWLLNQGVARHLRD